MKATNNPQINVRTYWDGIYSDPSKRDQYWDRSWRFYKTLEFVKDGDKFLDIGCGIATCVNAVKEKYPNCEVWGTDIAKDTMKVNAEMYPNIKFIGNEVGYLKDVPDNYFDFVFAGEILEHLDDPNLLIKDAFSKLKTGGTFVCTTPLDDHVRSPEHTWYFSKEDVTKLFKDNGFETPEFVDLPNMESAYVIYAKGIKK